MKVQLVHPPEDQAYRGKLVRNLKAPPVGLCIIGSVLRDHGYDVEIFDGNTMPMEDILGRIYGGVVGATSWYSNHQNSLSVLKKAKESGATTVIGGPNSNRVTAPRILRNHDYVDFANVGDGEESFLYIVKGENPSKIPNIVYNGGRSRNRSKNAPMDVIYDFENVVNLDYKKDHMIPLSSIRGCSKAEASERCTICSMDHKLALMEPDIVWTQIQRIRDEYGFKTFNETGDTYIAGNYPVRLLRERPSGMDDVKFRVFSTPNSITETTTDWLMELNVVEVFLGVENVNNDIIHKVGKPHLMEETEKAIGILKEKGIDRHLGILFGLPGDSEENMKRNYEFAERNMSDGTRILTNYTIPIPGSMLFENLRQNETVRRSYPGNLDNDDDFDFEALIRLQTKLFTSTDFDTVKKYIEKTMALGKDDDMGGFGLK